MVVNNRDLLRSYGVLKRKLINGEVEQIEIPQKEGVVLKIVAIREKTPFQQLLEKIEKKPLKGLYRPEEDII